MQLAYDMLLVSERADDERRPGWLRRGEMATDARDRLRAEREAAKLRLGVE